MNKTCLIFGLFVFVLSHGCYMKVKTDEPQTSKVKVIYRLPTYDIKGEPVIIVDSSYIYTYDSVFLYQTHVNDFGTIRQMQEDGSSQDSLIYDTMIPYYFLFKKNDIKGYGFFDLSKAGLKDKSVDSFLRYRPQIAFVLDTILQSAYKSTLVNEGGRFSKEYFFKNYSFNKIKIDFDPQFPDVPYSISTMQDSINQAKLTKVVFYINRAFVQKKLDEKFLFMELEILAPGLNARDSAIISILKRYTKPDKRKLADTKKEKDFL